MSYELFCLGNPFVDYVYDYDKDINNEAFAIKHEDRKFLEKRLGVCNKNLGGVEAKVAAYFSMIGGRSVFSGVVGKDENGDYIKKRLRFYGVKTNLKRKQGKTGVVIKLKNGNRKTMMYDIDLVPNYLPKYLSKRLIKRSEMFYFSGFSALLMYDTIVKGESLAANRGLLIAASLSSKLVASTIPSTLVKMLNSADIFVAKEEEVKTYPSLYKQLIENLPISSLIHEDYVELKFNKDVVRKRKPSKFKESGYIAALLYAINKGYNLKKCANFAIEWSSDGVLK